MAVKNVTSRSTNKKLVENGISQLTQKIQQKNEKVNK
jgi:hypothetical protein